MRPAYDTVWLHRSKWRLPLLYCIARFDLGLSRLNSSRWTASLIPGQRDSTKRNRKRSIPFLPSTFIIVTASPLPFTHLLMYPQPAPPPTFFLSLSSLSFCPVLRLTDNSDVPHPSTPKPTLIWPPPCQRWRTLVFLSGTTGENIIMSSSSFSDVCFV